MTRAPAGADLAETAPSRLAGLDALRIATLICIVAYHCLGTVALQASQERLGSPAEVVAWLLSVLQNEVLIALSAYLFAQRRRDLGRTLLRLAEIYLIWTVIYLFEALALGSGAWPFGGAELLVVLLFGGAKYHLPFFPALAVSLSLGTAITLAGSSQLWGTLAVAAAVARRALELETLAAPAPGAAEMLLLQGLTVAAYLPFAMLGFRLQRRNADGKPPVSSGDALMFFAAAACLAAVGASTIAIDWPTATEFLMAGRAAAIVAILFLALRSPEGFSRATRSVRLGLAECARLSLSVFLVHPLVIDLLAPRSWFKPASVATAGLLFVSVSALSLALARLAQGIPQILGTRGSR